jgi:hypothetical protein
MVFFRNEQPDKTVPQQTERDTNSNAANASG